MELPVCTGLKNQRAMTLKAKLFQPLERLVLRPCTDRNRNMDRNCPPSKICRKQNQIRLVRPHPFGKRAVVGEPAANELPARVHRTIFINAAFVRDTERTGTAWKNVEAANVDLEPAVATGGAVPA